MTPNSSSQTLRVGRSSADPRNPNAGKRHAARMTPAPRLSDGKRHPVTVSFVNPATARSRVRRGAPVVTSKARRGMTLPRVKRLRVPRTAEYVLTLAERAEARGHSRRAEDLLALALDMTART